MEGIYTGIILLCVVTDVYSDTGYFWHVTDFHYDFTYHSTQLSCNKDNRPTNPGEYGNFWCDSPWALVNSSVSAMASIRSDVDFVLWTGDTVLHTSDDNLNYTINAGIHDNTTTILKDKLPGVPVYATFGNHDYYPNNQFPPGNNELYNDTWNRWHDWVGNVQQGDNFRKGGYYTVKTTHGLRIIALNTNLYYTSNKATLNHDDPGDQLAWLNTTLKAAQTSNEKVLVTSHIPPGVHTPNSMLWMYPNYNTRLVDILETYADIIVGMHFGHDHADGFKIISNKAGVPSAAMMIAPSVTPWRYVIPSETGPAHNPGVRLVSYDRVTGRHLDYSQYYLDLEAANQAGVDQWKLQYKASTDYGLADLTAASFKKLADKMLAGNSEEFRKYWLHYTVSPPEHLRPPCDQSCHDAIYCGFTNFHMADFQSCKTDLISVASGQSASVLIMLLVNVLYLSL